MKLDDSACICGSCRNFRDCRVRKIVSAFQKSVKVALEQEDIQIVFHVRWCPDYEGNSRRV